MFEPFASPAPLSRRHFSRARDMSTARLVIVTACYGSRGDVAPLARLARAIQTATKATNDDDDERPTSVVFMANPHFADLAAGLDFHPTGDAAEYEARLADSKGRRHYGNGSVVDWWMRQLGTHVRAMRALFDGNQYESVVVVGHPLVRYFCVISRQSPHFVHPRSESEPRRALPPSAIPGPGREDDRGPRQGRPPRPEGAVRAMRHRPSLPVAAQVPGRQATALLPLQETARTFIMAPFVRHALRRLRR